MLFFTLLKGFVGLGILFIPNGFYNGGWAFSILSLFVSMLTTTTWMLLLVNVSNKHEGLSYSELGTLALGPFGKCLCDITLASSQASFVVAFTVFIVQNINDIYASYFGYRLWRWHLYTFWFFLYSPLTWVRRLQYFAKYHLLADIAIITTIFIIIIYTGLELYKEKKFAEDITPFNSDTYLIFMGTAIYAFEGVGIVLPIKDIAKNQEDFPKVLVLVITVVFLFLSSFGWFWYFVYGSQLANAPWITKLLPSGSIPLQIGLIFFMGNVIISYPLVIHPANMISESYIFRWMQQSTLRKWLKNINRTIIVGVTVLIGYWLEDSIDRLLSVIGSVTCTPVAFIMPATLHLVLAAENKFIKIFDIVVITLGLSMMIYLTTFTLMNWND